MLGQSLASFYPKYFNNVIAVRHRYPSSQVRQPRVPGGACGVSCLSEAHPPAPSSLRLPPSRAPPPFPQRWFRAVLLRGPRTNKWGCPLYHLHCRTRPAPFPRLENHSCVLTSRHRAGAWRPFQRSLQQPCTRKKYLLNLLRK